MYRSLIHAYPGVSFTTSTEALLSDVLRLLTCLQLAAACYTADETPTAPATIPVPTWRPRANLSAYQEPPARNKFLNFTHAILLTITVTYQLLCVLCTNLLTYFSQKSLKNSDQIGKQPALKANKRKLKLKRNHYERNLKKLTRGGGKMS